MSDDYEWDIRCADLELERLEGGFTTYDHINFARVLLTGLARAEADVHVETGALRGSMKAEIDVSNTVSWQGEISAGGPGVPYAASEFFGYSPKHGGYPSHQYFRRIGWQPTARGGLDAEGGVAWAQLPILNTGTSQGVPIQDDMLGPVTSFISRGRQTPHPENGGL